MAYAALGGYVQAVRLRTTLAVIAAAGILATTGCQEVRVGSRCTGNGAASSGAWVVACRRGRWTRWMTKAVGQKLVDDYVAAHTAPPAAPIAAPPAPPAPSTPPPTTVAPPVTIPPFPGGCALLCQALALPSGSMPAVPWTWLTSFQGLVASPDGNWIAFWSSPYLPSPPDSSTPTTMALAKNVVTGRIVVLSSGVDGVPIASREQDFVDRGPLRWSPDSSKVLLALSAPQLVSGVTGLHVYTKDVNSGAVTLISRATSGDPGNGASIAGDWSPDGSKVAFESWATNLGHAPAPNASNIVVKDLVTGVATVVSDGPGGVPADDVAWNPFWSPDGARVAFTTHADNVVAGTPPNERSVGHIVVHSMESGANTLADTTADGVVGDGERPLWNGASNLIFTSYMNFGPPIGSRVMSKNVQTGALTEVSLDASGRSVQADEVAVSPDGRMAVFVAGRVLMPDGSYAQAVVVRDLVLGSSHVLRYADGRKATGWSLTWAGDSRRVALVSDEDLAPGDIDHVSDVYLVDSVTGTVSVVSATLDGVARGGTGPLAFVAGSSVLVFAKLAGYLLDGVPTGGPVLARHLTT